MRRQVVPPKRYIEVDLVTYTLYMVEDINCCEGHLNSDDAMSFNDSSKWMIAMHEEMKSLHKWYLRPCEASKVEETNPLQVNLQKKGRNSKH